MRILAIFIFIFLPSVVYPQSACLEKVAQEITDEGRMLYRLELAAWYGMDIFKENYQADRPIGGYFTYIDSDKPKCLIFSKDENPKVIGTVSFGDIQIVETATIDFKSRDFRRHEKEIYNIRQKALEAVRTDSLFKTYTNSSLNLIPIISGGRKRVYVLTAPKVTDVVIFGNDYLLTFDDADNIIKIETIHKSLIPLHFNKDKKEVETFHTHKSDAGDFITPTDVCTLMLYAKFAGWKKHFVASDKYVSVWDCVDESLVIMTRDDFDAMD